MWHSKKKKISPTLPAGAIHLFSHQLTDHSILTFFWKSTFSHPPNVDILLRLKLGSIRFWFFFFLWNFFFLFLWKMAWMIVTSKTSSLASFVNCGYLFPISWVFCTWLFFQHLTFSVFEKVPLLLRAGKEIISHYWEKLKPEAILELRLSNGAWGFRGMPVSSITTLWNKNMYMDG